MDSIGIDVQSSQFMPTELPDIIDHFICKLCKQVVYQPKECPKCSNLYCFDCVNIQLSDKGKWQCPYPECKAADGVVEIHRTVKEILEKLVFSCPKCNTVKRTYIEINKHAALCDGEDNGRMETEAIESFKEAEKKQLAEAPVQVQYTEMNIYIMEKDSKKFYLYNSRTQAVSIHEVNCPSNFPHNFQAIQVGLVQTKVYIVGGGDFNQVPESMFQLSQIVLNNSTNKYQLEAREKMKFARHGHSCCSLGEKFIVVTGSRKDTDRAPYRTELYNTETNKWIELAQFNQGRHYHSSCSLQSKFIFVFCGISNETKKYLNTIERLEFNAADIQSSLRQRWEQIVVNNQNLLVPRQGSGVCQISNDEILIVGGFHGNFSNETFFFNNQTKSIRKAYNELKDSIFPFQVPTIADPLNQSVYTVDWQTYKLYEFKNDKWQLKKKIKP